MKTTAQKLFLALAWLALLAIFDLKFSTACAQGTTPSIVSGPPSYTITNGINPSEVNGNLSLPVSATGTGPLSYQWFYSGLGGVAFFTNGPIFSGTTTSNLLVNVVDLANEFGPGEFSSALWVVITNSFGSVTSSPAVLTFDFSPRIWLQPTNVAALLGGTAVFTVGNAAAGGNGPETYQWLFNGRSVQFGGIISTVAGNGGAGYNGDGVAATNASLHYPFGVAVDSWGNVYIADALNNRIRKVGANGVISTVAGTGSGGYNSDNIPATDALLNYPLAVAVDRLGDLFITDVNNARIRKVDTNGIISTVAGIGGGGYNGDGIAATNAQILYPYGVGVDNLGNVFIADAGNNRIRKVDTNGFIHTVAGSGPGGYNGDGIAATNAWLRNPYDVKADNQGNLFIADANNNRIRKVDTNGVITTVAGISGGGYNGDGILATNAGLSSPTGVAIDGSENIYVADVSNQRIRKIATNGIIATVAGTGTPYYNGDGIPATSANLTNPSRVALDNSGNLFIADRDANRIREVSGSHAGLIYLDYAEVSLVISNVNLADVGNYSVIISNPYGSVTSSIAALAIPPIIVSAPGNQTNNADANCHASVPDLRSQLVVTNGSGAITISQIPVPGTVVGLGVTNLTLLATDASNNVASATVTLTVLDVTPPTILTCATNQVLGLGNFTVATLPDLRGQIAASDCSGSVMVGQSPSPGTQLGPGTYALTFTATDASGNSNTCTAMISVMNTLPSFTNSPGSFTISSGGSVTFTAGANGTPPLSYQWQFNGTNIPGATSASLALTNISAANAGHYTVTVTGPGGSVTSASGALTVLGLNFYPVLTLYGEAGDQYRVEYVNNLGDTNWNFMGYVTLPFSPYFVIDTNSPNSNKRFYRAVYQP